MPLIPNEILNAQHDYRQHEIEHRQLDTAQIFLLCISI